MKSTNRFIFLVVALAVAAALAAQQARAATISFLDNFSDGGVVLNAPSPGVVFGSEGASSALGGWRAFTFNSSFNSSTLTLDDTAGTLRIDSTGLGQTTIGYGLRLTGGGLVGEIPNALNADLTGYLGLRFNIVENPIRGTETRMLLSVSLRTIGGGISGITQFGRGILPTSGSYDLLFADIPALPGGGVNLADVDFISITILNGVVGNSVAIGPIELIPIPIPEPTTLTLCLAMLSCGGGILLRRRRSSRTRPIEHASERPLKRVISTTVQEPRS